jgi:hypothetical protein
MEKRSIVMNCLDYAKTVNMGAWLRHPVLGDPSLDGAWYYFAGIYGYDAPADSHPDVAMIYDPESDLYWLSYDWSTVLAWADFTAPI